MVRGRETSVAFTVLAAVLIGCTYAQTDLGGLMVNQALLELFQKINAECQPFALWLAANCTTELTDISTAFGIPFPPPEDFDASNVSRESVEEFIATNPAIQPQCCEAACLMANKGCGCDQASFDALAGLFRDDGFIITSAFNYMGEACEFTPSLKSVEGSCVSPPNNMCIK